MIAIFPYLLVTSILKDIYDYLGIPIVEHLNMEGAISNIYKKASNKLYLFGIIRKYLN